MEKTPLSNRRTIGIFGDVNAGKSSLFNAILGQDAAIVSSKEGTTTDPVIRAMELIPFGPIALLDTAGLNDTTILSELRVKAAMKVLFRCDFAIYTVDCNNINEQSLNNVKPYFKKYNIPYILVFTKANGLDGEKRAALIEQYGECFFVDVELPVTIEELKKVLAERLSALKGAEASLLNGLLPERSTVVLVCPVDGAAPAGRLILPQAQLIRDCLDNNFKCIVTKPGQLKSVLEENSKIDLVVTDSQIFADVAQIVPVSIRLTSFSIVMARQKADLDILIKGSQMLRELEDGDKVLISEACTHNRTHEDIGKAKIPALVRKLSGADVCFDFSEGHDYPENLSEYKLVIHCGACMITKKAMKNRILEASLKDVPITNYGVLFALAGGILERSIKAFEDDKQLAYCE